MENRIFGALKAIFDQWMGTKLFGHFPYIIDRFDVASQTLDASPSPSCSTKLYPVKGVPVRAQKMQFNCSPGEQVVLAFAGGDPTQPFIAGLGYASDYSAALPIARQGDMVRCGGNGTLAAFYPTATPPVPPVVALGVPFLVSFGTLTSPPTPPPIQGALYGINSTGSVRVKIQ